MGGVSRTRNDNRAPEKVGMVGKLGNPAEIHNGRIRYAGIGRRVGRGWMVSIEATPKSHGVGKSLKYPLRKIVSDI